MESPSTLLFGLEAARGIAEYGLSWLLNAPLQNISPKGDGHPVFVLPGLGTTDSSTHFIRNFLTELGYATHPWGLGRNLGPRDGIDTLISTLAAKLEEIYENNGQEKVSIIGWSLGGIYGRELAKKTPNLVRQVITLGTPFKGDANATNVGRLYEILSKDTSHKDPKIIQQIAEPPPVPFTSLYSKTDGIVSWEASIETEGEQVQNIEIPGASHLGLGHNLISMYIIADRLAQPKNTWTPFKV